MIFLFDLWLLIQCVAATWIVWESLHPLVVKFLRPELHLILVGGLAYGALHLPAEIRTCLVIASLVAVIHLLFTGGVRPGVSAVQMTTRR